MSDLAKLLNLPTQPTEPVTVTVETPAAEPVVVITDPAPVEPVVVPTEPVVPVEEPVPAPVVTVEVPPVVEEPAPAPVPAEEPAPVVVEIVPVSEEDVAEVVAVIEEPPVDVTAELMPAISGMEGLMELMERPIYSRTPLTGLSGCEGFAVGVMSCYGADLRTFSGQEGFVENVKKGFNATIEIIMNAIKRVKEYFFPDMTFDAVIGRLEKIKSERAAMSQENREKSTPSLGQMKQVNEALHSDLFPKGGVTRVIDDNNLIKTFDEFLDDVLADLRKHKATFEDAKKGIDPKVKFMQERINEAKSQLATLKEDDTEKKAEIKSKLDEANKTMKEAQEELKELQPSVKALHIGDRLATKFNMSSRKSK